MAKNWTKADVSYLNRYSATKTLNELAERFGADPEEVRQKLIELKVDSKDAAAGIIGPDPATGTFEEAVQALYRKSWKKAEGLFQKVIEESESIDLTDRSRQYLTVCRSRSSEESAPADPYLRAVFHKNRGELALAMEACDESAATEDEKFIFLKASIHALAERFEEATEALTRAVEMNPENRVHAFHDPDFEVLREDSELGHLFGFE